MNVSWTDALVDRLDFFGQTVDRGALDAALRADGSDVVLRRFLEACLDLVQDVEPDLCAMARAEIAGARDDRAINRLAAGRDGFAAMVPGRAVWLAAMVPELPEEEGPAAVMLVNDLAAVGFDLPLRALVRAIAPRA